MKISTRLATGFSLMVFLPAICAGEAINTLSHGRANMDDVVNFKMKKYKPALDMRLTGRRRIS